jgi:uncharacterized membrane protein HdeD (DUF308 family)
MQFNAPKQITWWIAVVVGVIGIIASLVAIPVLSAYAFWLVVIAFVVLALATVIPNM